MFKFLRKNRVAVMAVLMVFVMSGYYFLANIVNAEKGEIATELRTISLSNAPQEDYQTVFEKFDDYELNTEGTLTTFTGSQTINSSVLQEIDNLSISETENIADCQVSYEFTYDVESNVITIYAYMNNEYGEVEVDKISGVCFIDDNNEIDAVMNIDGEGILLSEMRNAGKIQNCGWFANLVRSVATVVAVTAAVVAVAAVVVATCGTAAPAVAAAGVAAATVGTAATGAAATIAAVSISVAAIAAGVAITADLIEVAFEGITYRLQEYAKVASQLVKGLYYLCVTTKNGGMLITPVCLPSFNVAAAALSVGLNVYSVEMNDARIAAQAASNYLKPEHDPAHENGYFAHYHRHGHPNPNSHAFYGVPTTKGSYV